MFASVRMCWTFLLMFISNVNQGVLSLNVLWRENVTAAFGMFNYCVTGHLICLSLMNAKYTCARCPLYDTCFLWTNIAIKILTFSAYLILDIWRLANILFTWCSWIFMSLSFIGKTLNLCSSLDRSCWTALQSTYIMKAYFFNKLASSKLR